MHFNVIIISQTKNIYQILKDYVKFFIENLIIVINKLKLMLINQ